MKKLMIALLLASIINTCSGDLYWMLERGFVPIDKNLVEIPDIYNVTINGTQMELFGVRKNSGIDQYDEIDLKRQCAIQFNDTSRMYYWDMGNGKAQIYYIRYEEEGKERYINLSQAMNFWIAYKTGLI